MKANNALLVSFKPESGGYVPFIPLNQFLKNEKDFEAILKKVTIYLSCLCRFYEKNAY